MASRTAATGLGMGGPSDRRESWIPYPTWPDSGETEGTMDYADFTQLCQEDVDALFHMVNEAYASLEAANRQITTLESQNMTLKSQNTTLGSQNSDLEDENRRLKDQVSQQEEQVDELIDERDRLQRTVINLAAEVGGTRHEEHLLLSLRKV
jgi:chromosome segregation ATPase